METKLKELEEKEINWDKVKIDASISAMQAYIIACSGVFLANEHNMKMCTNIADELVNVLKKEINDK